MHEEKKLHEQLLVFQQGWTKNKQIKLLKRTMVYLCYVHVSEYNAKSNEPLLHRILINAGLKNVAFFI